MKKIKLILSIFTGLLFAFNYDICEYFYPKDLQKWWHLRHTLYAFDFLLFSLIAIIGTKGHVKLTLTILIMLILGDIWDRTISSITTFVNSDYVLIFMIILFVIMHIKKNHARKIQNRSGDN